MPAVDGFLPSTHGFHFANAFEHVPDLRIDLGITTLAIGDAADGLCGGMAYAVRDYWQAGRLPPPDTTAPTEGPLFDFLVHRLFDSYDLLGCPPGPARYLALMLPWLPDHETWLATHGLSPHCRGWCTVNDEWPLVRADLDAGTPSPLGLVQIASVNPVDLKHCHQVLAYGYDLSGTTVTLHVYDPNHPDDDTVTLSFDTADPSHDRPIARSTPGRTVLAFFRTGYEPADPPDPPPA